MTEFEKATGVPWQLALILAAAAILAATVLLRRSRRRRERRRPAPTPRRWRGERLDGGSGDASDGGDL